MMPLKPDLEALKKWVEFFEKTHPKIPLPDIDVEFPSHYLIPYLNVSHALAYKAGGYMAERLKRAEEHLDFAKKTLHAKAFEKYYGNKTVHQIADALEPLTHIRLMKISDQHSKSSWSLKDQLLDSETGKAMDIVWNTEGKLPEFPLDILKPGTEKDYVAYTIPSNGRIPDKIVVWDSLSPDSEIHESEQKDKCTCPDENFRFNGIGCKCGGI